MTDYGKPRAGKWEKVWLWVPIIIDGRMHWPFQWVERRWVVDFANRAENKTTCWYEWRAITKYV